MFSFLRNSQLASEIGQIAKGLYPIPYIFNILFFLAELVFPFLSKVANMHQKYLYLSPPSLGVISFPKLLNANLLRPCIRVALFACGNFSTPLHCWVPRGLSCYTSQVERFRKTRVVIKYETSRGCFCLKTSHGLTAQRELLSPPHKVRVRLSSGCCIACLLKLDEV